MKWRGGRGPRFGRWGVRAKAKKEAFRVIQNIKEDDYELGALDGLLSNK